jgi:peptidoglycan/xylan/chitin deacetylase (PgdA/CDA1 family)
VGTAKELVGAALRRSGVSTVIRYTVARRRVAVLSYHDPPPELVEQHLAYLGRRYSFVTLDRLAEALAGDWRSLPDFPVVVTIDDGHAGNAALLDVFRRHGVVPTIYLCSAIVGTGRRYWWTWDGVDAEALKRVPNRERLAALAARGFSETAEADPPQSLSRADVAELRGHVDFGSHTRFHPILPRCTDDEATAEIGASKTEVEGLTGLECRHFSFPNGDYCERDVAAVRAAGYATARTLDPGWVDPGADPLRLRLLGCADGLSTNELVALMAGLRIVRRLRRRPRQDAAATVSTSALSQRSTTGSHA